MRLQQVAVLARDPVTLHRLWSVTGEVGGPDRNPAAEEVIAAWPEEAFARLGGIDPATSIAVLTHDPKLDDAALLIALRSPARFVGAMGSRRAQAARRERLVAAGIDRR